jgi:small nuclear ribonucleoprotein (snRNP)-like protein
MKQDEAEKYMNKDVRVVISNGFRYHGKVIGTTEDTMIILDKFQSRVSLQLNSIVVLDEGVNNE